MQPGLLDLLRILVATTHPYELLAWGFIAGFFVQLALLYWLVYEVRCFIRGHAWGDAYSVGVLTHNETCYCCGALKSPVQSRSSSIAKRLDGADA